MAFRIRLYQTLYYVLLIITIALLLITPLSLITHSKPVTSREFLVPLILICAAYVAVFGISIVLYFVRIWNVRKAISGIPRIRERGRKEDIVRRERAIGKSAAVAWLSRPGEDNEVGGRDGIIKEVVELVGGLDALGEMRSVYEEIRWGPPSGGESDDRKWEGFMRNVGRLITQRTRELGADMDEAY